MTPQTPTTPPPADDAPLSDDGPFDDGQTVVIPNPPTTKKRHLNDGPTGRARSAR